MNIPEHPDHQAAAAEQEGEIPEQESRKALRAFALASFLNDFGSDMIYPVWPLFVTSVLGANMAVLGLLDGLGEAIVSLSQAASGYFSDRFGKRKVFIWTGYLFGSLSRIGYAFSSTWIHLIPFRILDRMGKIRSAPRDAIIADLSTDSTRGRNFGLLRSMDNYGAVCGIVTCMLLFNIGYQNIFLLAAIPSILGASLILLSIKERKASTHIYKGLSLKQFDGNLWIFLVLSAIFALGSFSYSFLLLYALEQGIESHWLPAFYLIFTLIAAIFSYPFGKLSDFIGRRSVLILAFIFWGWTCLSFLFVKSWWGMVFSFLLYGLHKGALEPVQKSVVAELAPKGYRASTLGAFQMIVGFCALPSSFLAGLLWYYFGSAVPLQSSIVLTMVAIMLLFFVKERRVLLETEGG
ncbi:MAG: MFS transporter [bacterium]